MLNVFISFANEDRLYRDDLWKHLSIPAERRRWRLWDASQVKPGDDVESAIRRELDLANIVLLLVSVDLLQSKSICQNQIDRALVRHRSEKICVIPLMVRDVVWTETPFAELAPLPKSRRSIAVSANADADWKEIVEELVRISEGRSIDPNLRMPGGSNRRSRKGTVGIVVAGTFAFVAFCIAAAIVSESYRRQLDVVKLLWAPADCGNQTDAEIGYNTCGDVRDLAWLQSQLNALRSAGVRGFVDLNLDPALTSTSYAGKQNYILYVQGRAERFKLGVGYEVETRTKDGCLRLYDLSNTRRSPVACLDENGQWWTRENSNDLLFHRVGR